MNAKGINIPYRRECLCVFAVWSCFMRMMDLTFVVKQPLTKYKVITKSQISKRSDFLCKFKSLSDNIPGLPDVIYLNHLPIPSAYEKNLYFNYF